MTVAHAGDGNVHPTFVFDRTADGSVPEAVWTAADEVFRRALELGGTLTGEHGVGVLKRRWLSLELGEDSMQLHRSIRQLRSRAGEGQRVRTVFGAGLRVEASEPFLSGFFRRIEEDDDVGEDPKRFAGALHVFFGGSHFTQDCRDLLVVERRHEHQIDRRDVRFSRNHHRW